MVVLEEVEGIARVRRVDGVVGVGRREVDRDPMVVVDEDLLVGGRSGRDCGTIAGISLACSPLWTCTPREAACDCARASRKTREQCQRERTRESRKQTNSQQENETRSSNDQQQSHPHASCAPGSDTDIPASARAVPSRVLLKRMRLSVTERIR